MFINRNNAVFLYIFLTLLLLQIELVKSLQIDTMDYKIRLYPDRPSLGLSSSGILKTGHYIANRNKTLIIIAPNGYGLLVAFKFLDLRPNQEDTLKLYTPDYPHQKTLFSYSNSRGIRNREDYSTESSRYVYTSGGQIAVQFITGHSYNTLGCEGFQLTYTVQGDYTNCESSDFPCNNGRCIASILQCDGHNHCGDRSEQEICFPSTPITDAIIIKTSSFGGIVGGVVCFLVAAACAIYIFVRKTRSRQTETVISQPPPYNQSLYPQLDPKSDIYYIPTTAPHSEEGISNPGYYE